MRLSRSTRASPTTLPNGAFTIAELDKNKHLEPWKKSGVPYAIRRLSDGMFFQEPGLWSSSQGDAKRFETLDQAIRSLEGLDFARLEVCVISPKGEPLGFNLKKLAELRDGAR